MSKQPIEHLDHFARNYKNRDPFLSIASVVSTKPTKLAITTTVRKLEEEGVIISPSGHTAEIAAQWCKRKGQSFQLLYQATLRAWVLRPIADKHIEEIAEFRPG